MDYFGWLMNIIVICVFVGGVVVFYVLEQLVIDVVGVGGDCLVVCSGDIVILGIGEYVYDFYCCLLCGDVCQICQD